jgi:hypothetical protein
MTDEDPKSLMPSEGQMFRVVVGAGIALLPAFIVSLVAGPGWAALVLAFEIGIGIGVWWRRRGSTDPGPT